MAINSTDFTAEQLYKQQELLKQENYVLQNHQRPFVPMGTPLEYQGKGVPTMAPFSGKSLADYTLPEARNRALIYGATAAAGLSGIGAGIGYLATGAFGRPVMIAAAKKAAPVLADYVETLKLAGGGGAGAIKSMEVVKNAKRLAESKAFENFKELTIHNPGLKEIEQRVIESGAKFKPVVEKYKDIYDKVYSQTRDVVGAENKAVDFLRALLK